MPLDIYFKSSKSRRESFISFQLSYYHPFRCISQPQYDILYAYKKRLKVACQITSGLMGPENK